MSTGPARTARLSAPERRTQILREAMRCFASTGYRGTTTREIAASSGITEAALYRYFPSKQALYDALIDEKSAIPAITQLVAEAAAQRDDQAVFRTVARTLIQRALGDPDFIRLLFFTALEEHQLADRFYRSRVGSLAGFLSDYIETRIGEGAFVARDAGLATRAFLGMVSDYINVRVIFAQGDAYPQTIDTVVESFVGFFLAGMRHADPDSSERSST
jgi:AcrR family transcriptional regulator